MDTTTCTISGERVSFICPNCKFDYSWSTALPSLQQHVFEVPCDGCGTTFSVRNPSFVGKAASQTIKISDDAAAPAISFADSASASTHLRRAYGLIAGVAEQTEQFRQQIARFSASLDDDAPFVQAVWSSFQGRRAVANEKARLESDLRLAESEIADAERIDPSAHLEVDDLYTNALILRAGVYRQRGVIECVWGTTNYARQCFEYSAKIAESAFDHFWLGLIAEDDYDPQRALVHFERCLEIEPDGDLSVPALREAQQMRTYRKRFRGNWGTVLLITLLFWPAVPFYIYAKWK